MTITFCLLKTNLTTDYSPPMLQYWLKLILNRIEPMSEGHRRYQRIGQAIVTGFLGKGLLVLVNLIAVRLVLGYLGSERYGAWMTISSLLAWLAIADFGLGNGLITSLSEAYAHQHRDRAQQAVATAFWLLVVIAIVLWLVLGGVALLVDWGWLLNVRALDAQAEVNLAVFVALFITLLGLPLSIIERIYRAYQEGASANYWSAVSSVLSLVALIIATSMRGDLMWLIVAFSGMSVVVQIVSALWIFGWRMPWLRPALSAVDLDQSRSLVTTSLQLFVLQIAALVILQSDNLIIARMLGAEAVTPYSITWRLFNYASLLMSFTAPVLWPAYAEANARGDVNWMRRAFFRSTATNFVITTALCLLLVLIGQWFVRIWTGSTEAVAPFMVFVGMALWNMISVLTTASFTLLGSLGRLRWPVVYGVLAALANIVFSIVFAQWYGITGVIWATVLAYVIFNLAPSIIQTVRILRPATTPPLPTSPPRVEANLAEVYPQPADDQTQVADDLPPPSFARDATNAPFARRVERRVITRQSRFGNQNSESDSKIPVINAIPPALFQKRKPSGLSERLRSTIANIMTSRIQLPASPHPKTLDDDIDMP